jgi:hypothetical protein
MAQVPGYVLALALVAAPIGGIVGFLVGVVVTWRMSNGKGPLPEPPSLARIIDAFKRHGAEEDAEDEEKPSLPRLRP